MYPWLLALYCLKFLLSVLIVFVVTKMADDFDVEAMLEAPYRNKEVRCLF